MKGGIIIGWLKIMAGLLVFSFGVFLTIFADIGLAPWDCLGIGISLHTPFNYGIAMTLVALIILLIDLLLREKIGYGTVIDALLTGNLVQLFETLNPFPHEHSLAAGILLMLAGLVFIAVGMWIYMSAGQCCGPRDTLLVGIGKKLSRLPIGAVEILLLSAVLFAGWLLGGPVGIGTLISTFGTGIIMQIVYALVHFEPRAVKHKDIREATKELLSTISLS